MSENVRTASDTIAREAFELTKGLLDRLEMNAGDTVSGTVNQDMISMVFGLHYSGNDDFPVLTATEGHIGEVFMYYCAASGAPEGSDTVRNMEKQIRYYSSSSLTRDEIISDTLDRLNWFFQKGTAPAYGEKCPTLPEITDLSTALGGIEHTLKETLPELTAEVLGWNEDGMKGGVSFESVDASGSGDAREPLDGEGAQSDEERVPEETGDDVYSDFTRTPAAETVPEEAKDAIDPDDEPDIPYVERPHIDQEWAEREAMKDDEIRKDEKPLGMRFHMFWCQFGLPLTVMMAGMEALMALMNVFQGGMGALPNIFLKAGVLFFGIPCLKSLRKFERKGWTKQFGLSVYSMCVKVMNIVMLGMNAAAAPSFINGMFTANEAEYVAAGITEQMLMESLRMQFLIQGSVIIVTAIFWVMVFVYYNRRRKYFRY